ncbi:MAG: phage virion morphogenesis protein [Betaproteobacteria bacterium]|nr:phage virion morphogenesis protein [Betaproteobacteria bacterium]
MSDTIIVECNSPTVLQALNRIMQNFTPREMRPAMQEIGEKLKESTKRRFATSTAPDESPWPPLKEGTVLARLNSILYNYTDQRRDGLKKSFAKKDGSLNKRGRDRRDAARANMKPLVKTKMLAESISVQIIDGGAGVAVGTNRFSEKEKGGWKEGAAVHQFGSRDGRIPARPFLGLSNKDERMVLDILNMFVQEAASPR